MTAQAQPSSSTLSTSSERSAFISSQLVDASIRTLEHASRIIAEEPELSVVTFAMGVELALKSRVAIEHWMLLIDGPLPKSQIKDHQYWHGLLNGQMQTIGAFEVLKLLYRITDTEERSCLQLTRGCFEELAQLRNRTTHFGAGLDTNSPDLATIAAVQLRAWHALHRYISTWPAAIPHADRWNSIAEELQSLDDFLETKAAQLRPELQSLQRSNAGAAGLCALCDHIGLRALASIIEATEQVLWTQCAVCDAHQPVAVSDCPQCGKALLASISTDAVDFRLECPNCSDSSSVKTFGGVYLYRESYRRQSDPDEHIDARCADCCGSSEVLQFWANENRCFVCLDCHNIYRDEDGDVSACAYCSEWWLGADLEHSYLGGCEWCDGVIGNSR